MFIAGVNLIINFFNFDTFLARIFEEDSAVINMLEQVVVWITAFAGLLFTLVYFMFFWVMAGFTPGKAVMGIAGCPRKQRTSNLAQGALVRMVGYWVSAIPFFLGYIWILFDQHRQGWHDKLADTYVVYVRDITDDE